MRSTLSKTKQVDTSLAELTTNHPTIELVIINSL